MVPKVALQKEVWSQTCITPYRDITHFSTHLRGCRTIPWHLQNIVQARLALFKASLKTHLFRLAFRAFLISFLILLILSGISIWGLMKSFPPDGTLAVFSSRFPWRPLMLVAENNTVYPVSIPQRHLNPCCFLCHPMGTPLFTTSFMPWNEWMSTTELALLHVHCYNVLLQCCICCCWCHHDCLS